LNPAKKRQTDKLWEDVPQTGRSRPAHSLHRDRKIENPAGANWRIDGAKGAALILDMHPSTLRSRMRKLGIQKA